MSVTTSHLAPKGAHQKTYLGAINIWPLPGHQVRLPHNVIKPTHTFSKITWAIACSVVWAIEIWAEVAPVCSYNSRARPWKEITGAPDSFAETSTSCQAMPPLQPVCRAFSAASFAANRAA